MFGDKAPNPLAVRVTDARDAASGANVSKAFNMFSAAFWDIEMASALPDAPWVKPKNMMS